MPNVLASLGKNAHCPCYTGQKCPNVVTKAWARMPKRCRCARKKKRSERAPIPRHTRTAGRPYARQKLTHRGDQSKRSKGTARCDWQNRGRRFMNRHPPKRLRTNRLATDARRFGHRRVHSGTHLRGRNRPAGALPRTHRTYHPALNSVNTCAPGTVSQLNVGEDAGHE